MQTTINNMNFEITTIVKTVLNRDVLSIIDDYKTSSEHFELHQKTTKKLRDEFRFIQKVILDTEETRYQYQEEIIVDCGYGEYILDWIEDERKAKEDAEFFEFFEIEGELDYGIVEIDRNEYLDELHEDIY